MKYYRLLSCLLTALSAVPFVCRAETIRFEAENVIVSPAKLPVNKLSKSHWDIWSTDVNNSWSEKKTLRSGEVKKDITPGKSNRELFFSIPIKKSGVYSLSCRTIRNVGFSLDNGKSWIKACNYTSLIQAKKLNAGDKISIRASACYTTPQNRGSIYLDYFELHLLPPPALNNPELLGKADHRGIPNGWNTYSSVRDQIQVVHHPGKAQIYFGNKGGFWLFLNNAELYGVHGDRFRVRIKIKNIGKKQTTIVLHYTGQVNKKIVNHAIDQSVVNIAPDTEKECFAVATVPANIESLRFRLSGSTPDTKIEVSDIKFEYLGNVFEAAKRIKFSFLKNGKLNWTAENAKLTTSANGSLKIIPVSGKKWTIRSLEQRPAISYEGINVKFSLQTSSGKAKVRARIRSFNNGQPHAMALNNGEWHNVSDKKSAISVQAYTPNSQCDSLTLEFDGYGDTVISDIAVERIPEIKWPEREIRKVPIPSYPAHKAKLGRGVTARPTSDGKLYVSWRLTSQDAENIAFDLFSCVDGKQTRLNSKPITQTTDFTVDNPLPGARYIVAPAPGFTGQSGSCIPDKNPYRTYKLADPKRTIYSIVPADLDGDGEFDYVVRSSVTNIDPILYFNVKNTPHYFIEAFHRDGRRLWSKDLGDNIETGVWFAPFTAADLDGDGKAEVICKGSAQEDESWVESEGLNKNKVMAGPEYILVLDGMTGKETARAPWPDRRPYYQSGYYAHNYFARNMMAIFRPDGKTDCILALRGTYTYMQAEAWKLENGKLASLWKYNNHNLGRKWWGQGAHNTRIADIDNDGRDEVILGAAVLDDDGSPLWTTGHGHPDYLFVGDITKKNPGLEIVTIYEHHISPTGGFTCADAKTGKVVWELKKPHKHIHRGYAADMDPRYRGWEVGGADSLYGGHNGPLAEYHWSPDGELLGENANAPYANYKPFIPHFAYWDGDLQKEVIEKQMRDHRGGDCGGQSIAWSFCAQFDSDGDWREEIVTRRRGEFRIYGTTIPAMDRRHSLMEDEIYRKSVLANSSGYLYDPSMGILLTDNAVNLNLTVLKDTPDTLEVVISAPLKKEVNGKLKLTAPDTVSLSRTQWDIKLNPAEIKTISLEMKNPNKVRKYIKAELILDNGTVLHGQVPAASLKEKKPIPKLSGIAVQAEKIHSERGGKIVVRSDKNGVSGKCFTHWDAAGHAITWKLAIPQDGKYTLQIRYCNNKDVLRRLRCNGVDCGIVKIKSSDAISGGEIPSDWQTADLYQMELKKGSLLLELENVDGHSTNMDYLKLVPVKNNK